jgi:hypothetical protein
MIDYIWSVLMRQNELFSWLKQMCVVRKPVLTGLLIILFLSTCISLRKSEKSGETLEYNKVEINFTTGDEYYYHKEMIFSRRGESIYGILGGKQKMVCGKMIIPEEVRLNTSDVELLELFCERTKAFKDTCSEYTFSTALHNYLTVIDSDTFRIERYCEWGETFFNNMEKQIFHTYFAKVKKMRLDIKREYNRKLIGKWYPNYISKKLNKGGGLMLVKDSTKGYNPDCWWKFDSLGGFESGCPELLDLTYSDDYRWNTTGKDTWFIIGGGVVTRYENGDTIKSVENYGANFILNSFTKDELVLVYLWD